MIVEFVERYKSHKGVDCYRWKVVAGEGILRRMGGGNPDVWVMPEDFILISCVAFWNGENRFVREPVELKL